MSKLKDLLGYRSGRLVVIARVENTKFGQAQWLCLCDCGQTIVVLASSLRSRKRPTRSCGCLRRERPIEHIIRGGRNSPEYAAFCKAKGRCSNPRNPDWKNYGGRGVEFRFESFEQFVSDVGLKPGPDRSLDRRNNNGHYEIGNVRWATRSEQMRNRRKSSDTTSKYWGVCRKSNSFTARIEDIHLGSFRSEKEAAEKYNEAALQLYGTSAHLNEIQAAEVILGTSA